MNFLFLLTAVFVILKLTNNLKWKWVWVLSPLWIPSLLFIALLILILILFVVFGYGCDIHSIYI